MIFIEETDNRFYIDKSTLPNAGWGLFAKELIKKDDWLEVIGVMVKKGGNADQSTHYARRYKFIGTKEDSKIVPLGFAGIVNHSSDPAARNMELTWYRGLAKRSEHASEVIYKVTRDIQPGEECFGDYGEQMSGEVEAMVSNMSFHNENKNDWEEFLSHGLYNLDKLTAIL